VLFFRDQFLTPDEQIALTSRWAAPMVFPVTAMLGGSNPLGLVTDTADNPPAADGWHTDVTWWCEPPAVAVLCAVSIPETGGDTLWASTQTLYDRMSEPLRRFCESLQVLHTPGERFIAATSRSLGPEVGPAIRDHLMGSHHPLVRTHPVSGRSCLFLSGSFMRSIDGLGQAESDALLGMLSRPLDDPNVQVRWRWQEGDVAICDEVSTNHRALSDHYPQFRQMRRCTAVGSRPYFSPDGARDHATFVSYPVPADAAAPA
jgi:taurine dioxygenase